MLSAICCLGVWWGYPTNKNELRLDDTFIVPSGLETYETYPMPLI